jgi:hypothetical protein
MLYTKLSTWVLLLGVGLISFSGCEPEARKGCTDYTATNYDQVAEEDDGTCEYLDSTVNIWSGGVTGFWGSNQPIGQVELHACKGTSDSITLDPDTLGNGLLALYLTKESLNHQFGLVAQTINQVDARPLGSGFMIFDVMLGPGVDIPSFDVQMNGNSCGNFGTCNFICRSQPVSVSTIAMTDSTWTEVTVPLLDFNQRTLFSMDNLFMVSGTSPTSGDTVLYLKEIRWQTVIE